MVTEVYTQCRHADRDTLYQVYLWQTTAGRDRGEREIQLFQPALISKLTFFSKWGGNMAPRVQFSESGNRGDKKIKRDERKEVLTLKASHFPRAVFQLQMKALSDSAAQLFSKCSSSEIHCTHFLLCYLICLSAWESTCAVYTYL